MTGMQTASTFCCGSPMAVAWISPCYEKNSAVLPHAILLSHRMNGIRHSRFLCLWFLPSPLPLLHHIRTTCMDSQLKTSVFYASLSTVLSFPFSTVMIRQWNTLIPKRYGLVKNENMSKAKICTATSSPEPLEEMNLPFQNNQNRGC